MYRGKCACFQLEFIKMQIWRMLLNHDWRVGSRHEVDMNIFEKICMESGDFKLRIMEFDSHSKIFQIRVCESDIYWIKTIFIRIYLEKFASLLNTFQWWIECMRWRKLSWWNDSSVGVKFSILERFICGIGSKYLLCRYFQEFHPWLEYFSIVQDGVIYIV